MDNLLNSFRAKLLPLKNIEYQRLHGLRGIARRGEGFADGKIAAGIVEYDEIGEGSPDIHTYPVMVCQSLYH
jgi:hypothetical protein